MSAPRALWGARFAVGLALGLAAACGDESSADPTPEESGGRAATTDGKADGPGVVSTDLLSLWDSGTWKDPRTGLERAWVDARVANVRYEKRVFIELAAPFAGGRELRFMAQATHRGGLNDGAERWGTEVFELYPNWGEPRSATQPLDAMHGVRMRARLQHDADGDGVDEMVVTGWRLLGSGSAAEPPTPDPFGPGLTSPVDPPGEPVPANELYFPPFDDAGAVVVREIDRVIAAQRADPQGRHTVHAAIFNINDPRIVDRLIAAHEAKVEVRLVTEARKFNPAQTWQTQDERLVAAGVPLLGLQHGGRGSMHTKFALFDGRRLATGSFNWETGSSFENHEDMLLTEAPALLAAYAQRFERLAGQPATPRTEATDPSDEVSVSFAPDEAPHRIAGALFDRAQHRILASMFTAKDVEYDENGKRTSMFRKLVAARKRGVEVTLMTDFGICEAAEYFGVTSEDDQTDEWLEREGIHVIRVDNPFGRYASMHHKFTVIDDEIAMLGAFNWYYDAAYLNDEDQIVWHDPTLAARLTGEFVDLSRRYDPDFQAEDWPAVDVQLSVRRGDTQFGDAVLVVGDLPELGAWVAADGLALDASDWPVWRARVRLPVGVRAEYKVVVRRADGSLSWDAGENHRLTVRTDAEQQDVEVGR